MLITRKLQAPPPTICLILLENLSDEYLLEIAHYFSSLKYPYPEAAANTLSPEETQTVETLIHSGDPERDYSCMQCLPWESADGRKTVYSQFVAVVHQTIRRLPRMCKQK